ncbi:AraC family transcriptional regulator [Myxococcus stipitatus DSM 14675]|uniref:AraC family transcriptional regulator n=2 Tax=Myxococcus stipitatus TaxID=83455 RepID=L7U5S5_MYXSD|nr:AraC family transcriptional regulator [Myxococcus stipitatus]AGC43443.1 AraC family transcriptional regulator [Myxococcus stipitatus DSM 14675]
MSSRPKELAGRPGPRETHGPDVLADVLDSMRLSTLMYGRLELSAPWGLQFCEQACAHLILLAHGSARLDVEGLPAPITLSSGDLAVLPQGVSHTLRDAEGSPLHLLEHDECQSALGLGPIHLGGHGERTCVVAGSFRPGAAPHALLFERLPRLVHVTAEAPSLAAAAQLIITESTSPSPGATVIMSRLADILLVQALRLHLESSQDHEPGLGALADPRIGKALALIHERPAEPWTVESLASAVALSRSGFAARFTSLVGKPPLEYLARWRMTKAAQLLRESETPLTELATVIGYQSEASFNRAFKRWEGSSPGVYRREHRRRAATQ